MTIYAPGGKRAREAAAAAAAEQRRQDRRVREGPTVEEATSEVLEEVRRFEAMFPGLRSRHPAIGAAKAAVKACRDTIGELERAIEAKRASSTKARVRGHGGDEDARGEAVQLSAEVSALREDLEAEKDALPMLKRAYLETLRPVLEDGIRLDGEAQAKRGAELEQARKDLAEAEGKVQALREHVKRLDRTAGPMVAAEVVIRAGLLRTFDKRLARIRADD